MKLTVSLIRQSSSIVKPFEAITEYQERGVHTFPLSRNKMPVVKKWNDKDFTLEQHQVGGFEGIGTCLGRWNESVMVFDVDGPEGQESWARCVEKYGALPDTFTVTTGGGMVEHTIIIGCPKACLSKVLRQNCEKLDLRGTRGKPCYPLLSTNPVNNTNGTGPKIRLTWWTLNKYRFCQRHGLKP